MKTIFLALFLSLISFSSFGLIVISDLDDTLKITNVSDTSDAIRNAFFSKKAFLKFPELLNNISQYSNGLYFLSGSPTFLRKKINQFLDHHNISRNDVILKNIFRERNSYAYKLKELRRLFKEMPNEDFILIGDDTEYDAKVYTALKAQYPMRIKKIYIRAIKNSIQPIFIEKFFTAYDIAVKEYLAGRMDLTDVLLLGKSFILAKSFDLVIPDFAYCPNKKEDFPRIPVTSLELVNKQIKFRLKKHCSKK